MCESTCESIWVCSYTFPNSHFLKTVSFIFWKQSFSSSLKDKTWTEEHWKTRTILKKEIGKFLEKKSSLGKMELFGLQAENLIDKNNPVNRLRLVAWIFLKKTYLLQQEGKKLQKPPSFAEKKIFVRILMQQTPWQVYKKTTVQVSMKHRWVVYTQTFGFKWFRERFSKSTWGV